MVFGNGGWWNNYKGIAWGGSVFGKENIKKENRYKYKILIGGIKYYTKKWSWIIEIYCRKRYYWFNICARTIRDEKKSRNIEKSSVYNMV